MNQSKTSASYAQRERDDTCIENIAWLAARSVLQSYNDTETFFGLLQAIACGMIRHYHSPCSTHCLVLSALALVHRRSPYQPHSQLSPSHSTRCEVSIQSPCVPQPLQRGRCCMEEFHHCSHHTPGCRQ